MPRVRIADCARPPSQRDLLARSWPARS